MRHLKCLELQSWMEWEWLEQDDGLMKRLQKIEPIMNRNGYYYDRLKKKCWFESEGLAFEVHTSNFKYTFENLDHKPMTSSVYSAYCTLRKDGVLGKKELYLLTVEERIRQFTELTRNVKLSIEKTFKGE